MKIELGSGPFARWYWKEALHFDAEPYAGCIKWVCPEPIPVDDKSVDEAYIGRLLIEMDIEQHKALADELARVMKESGKILMRVYDGSIGFPEFFYRMREHGWFVAREEVYSLTHESDGAVVVDYFITLEYFGDRDFYSDRLPE